MWTLEKVRTGLDNYLGPKMIPTAWILNLKCSRETTTETFDWSEISQWEKQISTNSWDRGISSPLEQKTLAERKFCHECWHQQCPKTRLNNSNWLTRRLMLWKKETEGCEWLCPDTTWGIQKIQKLKSHSLHGRRMTRSFNKLFMWFRDFKKLKIYLM